MHMPFVRDGARRPTRYPCRLHVESLEARYLLSVQFAGLPQWQPLGPEPILLNTATPSSTTRYSQVGAVEAVAIHPTNADILYLAAVNGGIWKTENATISRLDHVDNDLDGFTDEPDEVPTWTPLTDDYLGLSMGAIAFDPLDTTYETLYAGQGRFSSLGLDGGFVGGLMRTTDGGQHWTELDRTTLQGQNFEAVVPTTVVTPTGQVILAASYNASGGIFRSVDGGNTFQRVSGTGNLPAAGATQLLADPSQSMRFFAAVPNHGVYRSTDGGQNWQAINTGITGLSASIRIGLTVHADTTAGTHALYAGVIGSNGSVSGVFRSTTFGASWTPFSNLPGTGEQGNVHWAMAADPDDPQLVFVGGQSGNYLGNAQTGTWTRLVGAATNNSGSHADHRFFAYDLAGNILDANDGGLYRLVDPDNTATRAYESLNGNLQITEVNSRFSLAYDTLNDIAVIGTQDNGTAQTTIAGEPYYRDMTGGDGNSTAVEIDGNVSYRYFMSNNWGYLSRFQYDNQNQVLAQAKVKLAAAATPNQRLSGLKTPDRKFGETSTYTAGPPLVLNAIEPSRLLLGTGNGVYESSNRGDTITDITPGGADLRVSALAYGGHLGGTDNVGVVYVGLRTRTEPSIPQLWLRSSSGGAMNQLTTYTGSVPMDIVLDPLDWRVAYVLDNQNRIWRTSDAGQSAAGWTELTQGNALLAGKSLRSLEMLRIGGTPVLLVGAGDGVYRRISPTQGSNALSWSKFGIGLPHAPVQDMFYDPTDGLLVAGTLGRGVWSLSDADLTLPVVSTLTVNGDLTDDGQFTLPGRDDLLRIAENPYLDGYLDFYLNDLGTLPQYTVESAAVQTIEIVSGDGDDFIQVDFLPEQTALNAFGGNGRDVFYTTTANIKSTVSFEGGSDPDWFAITPSPDAEYFVTGGAPTSAAAVADTLRVFPGGQSFTVTPGPGVGEGIVDVQGAELIRYFETEEVTGTGPQWRADTLEPNNSRLSAFDLVGGNLTLVDLTIHDADNDDWYEWTATHTGTLVLTAGFDHSLGDIDLELFNSSGSLLVRSNSSTDDESITAAVTANSTYYFRVYGFNGATQPRYYLEVDWPFGFPDDFLENNDSFATARDLGSGDQSYEHLAITPVSEFIEDEDWYVWQAPTAGSLAVDIQFVDALGNLDLELRSAGNSVLTSSTSTDDNEQVTWAVATGGLYYIRVFGFGGSTHPDYDLSINGPEIQRDYLENDTVTDLGTSAKDLSGLTIHNAEDEDWYAWRATAGGSLSVQTLFSDALGDVDLELYDGAETFLVGAYSTTDNEQVSWTVNADETYLIRVYGFNGATQPDYDLVIGWPLPIPPDFLEPNDSSGEAALLGQGDIRLPQLTIHPLVPSGSSDDWYAWQSGEDGFLEVTTRFLHAEGDVDLQLYDGALTLIASSTSTTNEEQVFAPVAAGELYFVRVFGFNGADSSQYELIVNGPDLVPDVLELNNTFQTAAEIGMGDQFFSTLSIDQAGDEDWYRWTSPADGELNIAAFFEHRLGDLDLAVYRDDGTFVDSSTSTLDEELVSLEVAAGDTYRIQVYGYLDATNRRYGLEINGPDIAPDGLEANDTLAEATDLGSSLPTLSHLTIHEPGNGDWFRWQAPASGVLTVDARFVHEQGDLDMVLFTGEGTELMRAESESDNEQIAWPVQGGATYVINLFGASSSQVPKLLMEPRLVTVVAELQPDYELALAFAPNGDFNGDGQYNCEDIDPLIAEIAAGTHDVTFDLTGDALVTVADRDEWLAIAGSIELGSWPVLLAGRCQPGRCGGYFGLQPVEREQIYLRRRVVPGRLQRRWASRCGRLQHLESAQVYKFIRAGRSPRGGTAVLALLGGDRAHLRAVRRRQPDWRSRNLRRRERCASRLPTTGEPIRLPAQSSAGWLGSCVRSHVGKTARRKPPGRAVREVDIGRR